jgi:hypothetical protein
LLLKVETYTITITIGECDASDWTFVGMDTYWFKKLLSDGSLQSINSEIQLAKSSSITLKAEFKTDRSADCGVTKYEQSIIIADGNTETILNPCVDFTSIPLCFGW